jgi:hypothetical protein
MDVAAWLRGLGLEQYAPAFHDNAIDGEVLRELTADDLKDLGVTLIGHRRKLLAAIDIVTQQHGGSIAVDSKVPFPSEQGSLHVDSTILPGAQTVDQHFQAELTDMTTSSHYQRNKRVPAFQLMPLDRDVRKRLAEVPLDPWLGETLKRGPVNPVPVPPHIQSVPFGLI